MAAFKAKRRKQKTAFSKCGQKKRFKKIFDIYKRLFNNVNMQEKQPWYYFLFKPIPDTKRTPENWGLFSANWFLWMIGYFVIGLIMVWNIIQGKAKIDNPVLYLMVVLMVILPGVSIYGLIKKKSWWVRPVIVLWSLLVIIVILMRIDW